MSTITSLGAADTGATSRGVINTNFTNLNTDKVETSVLDTDVTLSANSDSKVATQKAVKAYVDIRGMVVENTVGATHSLTTTVGQVVVVFAKGWASTSGNRIIQLKYNTTVKDATQCAPDTAGNKVPFALNYSETPGAGTQNITVVDSAGGTVNDVVITVFKLG